MCHDEGVCEDVMNTMATNFLTQRRKGAKITQALAVWPDCPVFGGDTLPTVSVRKLQPFLCVLAPLRLCVGFFRNGE
jgi:hypothetical protein